MKQYAFYLILLCIFIGCKTQNSPVVTTELEADTSVVIDISGLYTDSAHGFIDNYVSQLKLICLETTDSSIISGIDEVVSSSELIFIRDSYNGGGVAIFDTDGKFIKRLPNGPAPFEIGSAGSIFFDNISNLLYLYDKANDKVMKFSRNGDFLSYHYSNEFPLAIAARGDRLFFAERSSRNNELFFDIVVADTTVNILERWSLGKLFLKREGLNRFFHTFFDGITVNIPWNYTILNFADGKWTKDIIVDNNSVLNVTDCNNSFELQSMLNESQMFFKGVSFYSNSWWMYRFYGKRFARTMLLNTKTGEKWFAEPLPHSLFNLITIYGVEDTEENNFIGVIDPAYMTSLTPDSDFCWDGSNPNNLLSSEDIDKLKSIQPDDNPVIVTFKLKSDLNR